MAEPKQQESASQSVPLTGVHVGRFVLGERVGRGGMGEVYSAEDTRLQRKVALKRVDPRLQTDPHSRERLLREARHACRFTHPNVAAVYDVLEQDDQLWLVMELVPGETLRERMPAGLSVAEVISIGWQCAQALRAAHAAGLVHCDIKPDNIMLASAAGAPPSSAPSEKETAASLPLPLADSAGLQVKLLDFGIAKLATGAGLTTQTHVLSGTPGYIAPELLQEQVPDGRADIFSLGVVLYEALAGSNPFKADTLLATAERILKLEPPPLRSLNPQVSPQLEGVIHKMLAKDRDARYASAQELLDDLDTVRTASSRELLAPVRGARNWMAALALLLLGIVFSFGLLLAGHKAGAFRRWFGPKPPARNIAVLPFETSGEGASTQAFADGLAETVAARLTQLSDRYPLEVISPSEARQQGAVTTEQARRLLGVHLVLTGTLRSAGSQVRVNYRLVDADSRRELRGDTVTVTDRNPFALEDRVVDSVLGTLEIALAPRERQALAAHRTAEPQAYDYYLQGRGYLQDFHKVENTDSAIAVFQRALERDPNYALAYAGLGEAYWYKYENTKDAPWVTQALSACERAVALDGAASAGHTCLGMVYYRTGDDRRAIEQLRRALELDPTSDEASRWLAASYARSDPAQAEAIFQRAIKLRPNYWGGYHSLGVFYSQRDRYADAVAMFQKVVALTPDNFRGYSNLGGVYLKKGDYAQALPYLERSVAIRPTGRGYSNLGIAYYYMRQFPQAAQAYEQAIAAGPVDYILWGNLGEAYYRMSGKRQEARQALAEALKLATAALKVNSRDTDALSGAAEYNAMLGQGAEAKSKLRQALALAPRDSELLLRAAVVYRDLGDLEASRAALENALANGLPPGRIRGEPAFDALKSDPRFSKLMQP